MNCNCNEYRGCENAVLRKLDKCCKAAAVIPVLTVKEAEGIKNVAACFVHVMDNNTTYYIDDKHRIVTVWAGPIFYDSYDYATNPLDLRGQVVYDFANNRKIVYNNQKEYRLETLTEA